MKFLSRSLLILLALYGLVFALVNMMLAKVGAPLWLALLFAVFTVVLQYLTGPWIVEWIFDIFWDDAHTHLPAANREFIEKVCAERGLPVPRVGIIDSGTPNAFCFGHVRSNSRVVVTTGLLDVLTPEESNAVLAHEIGHIEHRDFIVMTVAALAPLLLYQLYVFADKIENTRAVAYTSYLFYWISQFVVLLLNRTREYYADQYSGMVTRMPNALSSALVKIAYGMVRADGAFQEKMQDKAEKKEAERGRRLIGALALMGISNLKAGAALALGQANPGDASAVMKWDLVNPWARLYELNSTHPLTAFRVRELNRQAEEMHQASEYRLPIERTIRWGAFPLEVLLWATPVVAGVLAALTFWEPKVLAYFGLESASSYTPALVFVAASGWILRTWFRYHGDFRAATVGELIEDVEVSNMRPLAVEITGEIIGRGVPGVFWSPDLVLRDATGMVFVLYRQSIPLLRFLFAITAAEQCIGQQVTIRGWFRRGMTPYVEMSQLTTENGETHRAYSRWVQYAVAGIAAVLGLLWMIG